MMTGQNSGTWDEGTVLNLMRTFLPGWCCGRLRTLSFVFWRFLRYFWKEIWPFPFRWLGTSHSWTQAVVLQSSSAPSTQAPPRPKQRRTKLGTESPPLHMLINKLTLFLLETRSQSLLLSPRAIYLEKTISLANEDLTKTRFSAQSLNLGKSFSILLSNGLRKRKVQDKSWHIIILYYTITMFVFHRR